MASASGRTPTWAKVLIGVVVAVVAVVGGFVLWLAAMLSGGFDDLFAGDGPRPEDARVRSALDRAQQANARVVDGLVAGPVAEGLGRVRVSARFHRTDCRQGQHNWKIDNSFDLSCDTVDGVVLSLPRATFREDMLRLDAALAAAGEYEDQGMSLARVVRLYWDQRAERPAGYGIADLPAADYVERLRPSNRLTITYSGPGRSIGPPWPGLTWTDTSGRQLTLDEAMAVSEGPTTYALILGRTTLAFEE